MSLIDTKAHTHFIFHAGNWLGLAVGKAAFSRSFNRKVHVLPERTISISLKDGTRQAKLMPIS